MWPASTTTLLNFVNPITVEKEGTVESNAFLCPTLNLCIFYGDQNKVEMENSFNGIVCNMFCGESQL